MKIVLIGGTALGIAAAKSLTAQGDDVVIIDQDKETIAGLTQELDCGFIHGDGTKPAILREAGPGDSDLLLCLTDNDQANILSSLVGRSLGFPRVVPKIDDPEFEHICIELSLVDTIIPHRRIAQALADLAHGKEPVELSPYIKGEARMFVFAAGDAEDGTTVSEIDLPRDCRVVCLYRGDEFILPAGDTKLRKSDEVVLITHQRSLTALTERWAAKATEGDGEDPPKP